MRMQSIARRLIVSVLLIQVISALGVVLATLIYERHTQFKAFDVMLRGRADSLLGAVQDADDEADDIMLDRTNLQVPAADIYEVQEASGRVLGRSANWAGISSARLEQNVDGVFRTEMNGRSYRLIRLHGLRLVDPGKASGGIAHSVTIVYGAQTHSVWSEIWEAVGFYAAASCLLLLVTGSLVAWLLHRGLFPLRQLASEAEGISAERWTFSPSQTALTTRELAPLASALSSAVKRLQQSFQQQRRFVSDAAHELKTSVAVLKSSLQLLNMRQRSPEEYEAGLYRCLGDCERMEDIVAKMLMLARFENLRDTPHTDASTDFSTCAIAAWQQLEPIAEQKNVKLTANHSRAVHVPLHAEQATLLCSNLLLNALQHSQTGAVVEVSIRTVEAALMEFRVEDHGHGIDPDVLPHVFERFYRGDPSRARKSGGTGLGLAICRAIAQSAGGSIRLESARGVGTVAIVELPVVSGLPVGLPATLVPGAASSACINEPVEH